MEGITRIVSESLARHGFDRPLDYRRLHWSRWFRCESHHSLLVVPSKPGVFALAEEIMDFAPTEAQAVAAAEGCLAERSSAAPMWDRVSDPVMPSEARLPLGSTDAPNSRRMLAVTQFFEDDDMAFVLDRMLSRDNPMRARLVSGRYFVRFVVIQDGAQRCSICAALNQWIASSGEKASGIGSHFAAFPDVGVGRTLLSASAGSADAYVGRTLLSAESCNTSAYEQTGDAKSSSMSSVSAAPQLESGAASNIHCPCPFPSGF
jgi:hypothetical protein